MTDAKRNFWQSPLGIAVIGGAFALMGTVLTWFLNQPEEGEQKVTIAAPSVKQLEFEEKQRKYALEKSCTQTARGRFEAALYAQPLLKAVQAGSQTIPGNGEADQFCKASKFIDAKNLDTGVQQSFVWIEDTTSEGSKVICKCST